MRLYGKLNTWLITTTGAVCDVTDEALADAARRGERDAYTQLTARYRNMVYAYLYARLRSRDEAEDLTQEAFVRAYLALASFRRDGRWASWMMRIARNLCNDALRSRQVRQSEPLPDDWLDSAPTPELLALARARRQQLNRALDSLPEKYRTALVMHYASGQKCREIALALELPESTVKGRIASALRLLRQRLPEEEAL